MRNAEEDREIVIPEALIRRFEVEYLGPDHLLAELLRETADPLHRTLVEFLASIDPAQVEAHLQRKIFRDCHRRWDERQREQGARLELAEIHIAAAIGARRKACLLQQADVPLPEPYAHHDLQGIGFGDDRLVRSSLFDRRQGAFERGATVFQLLPTLLTQANSVYWVNLVLNRLPADVDVKVRLDPLMSANQADYLGMFYAMRAYGRPLDWLRLEGMKDGYSEDLRWYPDGGAETEVAFTDLVWSRRADELQLTCEEVPTPEATDHRGGRYFHSIYHPGTERFSHADGAIRFYDRTEIEKRAEGHVRDAGKLGRRVKIFRADGAIPRDEWCSLAASFFVWNDDVHAYFSDQGPRQRPTPDASSARKSAD